MSFMIIFMFGYLFGGVSALTIIGLTMIARNSDRAPETSASRVLREETVATWRNDG